MLASLMHSTALVHSLAHSFTYSLAHKKEVFNMLISSSFNPLCMSDEEVEQKKKMTKE